MPERRVSKRRPKRLKLKYGLNNPESIALTEDISPEGIFIKSTRTLSPGKTVQVEIFAPDNSKVLFEGRVMWMKRVPPSLIQLAKKGGMGVKITKFLSGKEIYMELCKIMRRE
jgi:hypothetical protein